MDEETLRAIERRFDPSSYRVRRGAGKVTLRLNVSEDLYRLWRVVESAHGRGALPGCFVEYLCFAVWESWRGALGGKLHAYFDVYLRDRFRCRCPVCNRRDVTPHHLKFRSRGGGDEDDNLASTCTWCHLDAIYSGKMKAEPLAGSIRWSIGRRPIIVVEGRTKLTAAA